MTTGKKRFDEKKLPLLAYTALTNCPKSARGAALANICKTTRQAAYSWLEGTRGISTMSSELLKHAVRPLQTLELRKPHSLRPQYGEMVYHIRSERDEVLLCYDRGTQHFRLTHRKGNTSTYPATLSVGLALVDLTLALLYGS